MYSAGLKKIPFASFFFAKGEENKFFFKNACSAQNGSIAALFFLPIQFMVLIKNSTSDNCKLLAWNVDYFTRF